MQILTILIELRNRYRRSQSRLWLQYLNTTVLKRSLLLALIIGSLLTLTNQFDALVGSSQFKLFQLTLVFMTPFIVITISQLVATKHAATDDANGRTHAVNTPLITTLRDHSILFRALIISMAIGSLNSMLIFINTILQTGSITNTSLILLAQVYVLPFIFGVFSQALAYRRYYAKTAAYPLISQKSKQ